MCTELYLSKNKTSQKNAFIGDQMMISQYTNTKFLSCATMTKVEREINGNSVANQFMYFSFL